MKKVIIIPEVKNLEDELVRSCNIANVKELMKSKSNSEYKSDLAKCKNLKQVLINHHFDINSFGIKIQKEHLRSIRMIVI